jgi:hypothetical protein
VALPQPDPYGGGGAAAAGRYQIRIDPPGGRRDPGPAGPAGPAAPILLIRGENLRRLRRRLRRRRGDSGAGAAAGGGGGGGGGGSESDSISDCSDGGDADGEDDATAAAADGGGSTFRPRLWAGPAAAPGARRPARAAAMTLEEEGRAAAVTQHYIFPLILLLDSMFP